MAEKMSVKFENSVIDGGVLNGAILGDNNIVDNVIINTNDSNIEEFGKYLDYIASKSDSDEERRCASQAKALHKSGNKEKLKNFMIENISTFTSGTFATLAGGALLEMVKGILK